VHFDYVKRLAQKGPADEFATELKGVNVAFSKVLLSALAEYELHSALAAVCASLLRCTVPCLSIVWVLL
jgi:hypothetical protein